jgi:hypothetical protein
MLPPLPPLPLLPPAITTTITHRFLSRPPPALLCTPQDVQFSTAPLVVARPP